MILLYPSPYIQVVVNSSFSCGICYFIFMFKPYKTKLDNIMNLYIEVVTFLILSIIGVFIYEDLHTTLFNLADWSLVVMIYLSIIIPALTNLMILVKDLTTWFIAKCRIVPKAHEQTGAISVQGHRDIINKHNT